MSAKKEVIYAFNFLWFGDNKDTVLLLSSLNLIIKRSWRHYVRSQVKSEFSPSLVSNSSLEYCSGLKLAFRISCFNTTIL